MQRIISEQLNNEIEKEYQSIVHLLDIDLTEREKEMVKSVMVNLVKSAITETSNTIVRLLATEQSKIKG